MSEHVQKRPRWEAAPFSIQGATAPGRAVGHEYVQPKIYQQPTIHHDGRMKVLYSLQRRLARASRHVWQSLVGHSMAVRMSPRTCVPEATRI